MSEPMNIDEYICEYVVRHSYLKNNRADVNRAGNNMQERG